MHLVTATGTMLPKHALVEREISHIKDHCLMISLTRQRSVKTIYNCALIRRHHQVTEHLVLQLIQPTGQKKFHKTISAIMNGTEETLLSTTTNRSRASLPLWTRIQARSSIGTLHTSQSTMLMDMANPIFHIWIQCITCMIWIQSNLCGLIGRHHKSEISKQNTPSKSTNLQKPKSMQSNSTTD